jgi:hypothetical protein
MMPPKNWRYFWPALAVLSLMLSGYLWRRNLMLQASVARWRAEQVTAQVTAFKTTHALDLKAKAPARANEQQPSPGSPNIGTQTEAEKTLSEPLTGEVLVSYGTIEQMGSTFADFFSSQQARNLRSTAEKLGDTSQALTLEETARGQRALAEIMGMLPEVEKFQDQPTEYGRFFKGLLQAGGNLTDAEAQAVETLMRQRAEEGIRRGVNAGRKPQDGLFNWELQRDAYNEETAAQLRAILPRKAQEIFPVDGPFMEFLEMDLDAAGISLTDRK